MAMPASTSTEAAPEEAPGAEARLEPGPGCCPADIEPVQNETLHRTITGLVTGVPVLALGVVVWQAWDGLIRPRDLVVFAIVYVLTGLGVTVGFHRMLTPRSFKARPVVRAALA